LITLINGIDIYNNTCYNYAVGLEIMSEGGAITNARAYNNIFSNISDNNVEAYQDPALLDYNAYWPSCLGTTLSAGRHVADRADRRGQRHELRRSLA
jgi:hypothetical protein